VVVRNVLDVELFNPGIMLLVASFAEARAGGGVAS
jgi:hypothetical protein